MRTADKVFYHGGVILGLLMVAGGIGQLLLGVRAGDVTNLSGWGSYAWLGAFQAIIGVAWLLLWVFYQRPRIRNRYA